MELEKKKEINLLVEFLKMLFDIIELNVREISSLHINH